MTSCEHCHAPDRDLYGPGRRPALSDLDVGTWISLCRCVTCGALWCASLYEPYAAFEYVVRWTHSPADWRRVHDLDDGRMLLRWHATEIRMDWRMLPDDERRAVDAHRKRSGGHNPIDNPAAFGTFSAAELMLRVGQP